MAFSQSNIGRVRLGKQTAWNNATPSPAFSAIHVVEAEVFLPELATEVLSTDAMRGNYAARRTVDGGKSNIPISLRMPLHGWSTATPPGDPTSSNQHPDALILEYALGASTYCPARSKTTHSSPGTASTTVMASGEALTEGHAMLCAIGADSFSVGWSKDVSGDSVTWAQDLSSAPHASTDGFGSMLQYMDTASPATGLVMHYQGQDANTDITLSNGMVTSAKIIMNPNAQPMLEAELVFGAWALGTSGAPGLYEYTLPQLPVAVGNNGARLMVNNSLNSSVFTVELDLSVEYQPVLGHSAAEGISQYIVTNRDATLTITEPTTHAYNDMNVAGGTAIGAIQVDLCTTPGRAFSMLLPSAVLENTRTLGDNNGVVGTTSVYKAGYYDNDGSDSAVGTAPADTIVRTAFL
ncbi:hypothetical protein [Acinetobacter sp.]|uniref:hypothetical protein n=1 Tax=Acinetobacter sp. TaxID=472 RepID=UPI000C0A7F80|nr:hypothetical protein [Acinetobacter sp.]MAK30154.1 hypothetical protein [Acinetobacter sp.]|tara:strand:+ start:2783 stop:4009 length:1227 start_codon:yes stop_codon:yes gene_type:complete